MGAKRTIGTTLTKGGTNIGGLTSISTPEKSADTIDTTTLDAANGYKTYIQGIKDGGEITVKGFFDTSDAGQMALDTAFEAGTLDEYIITFPSTIGATFTLSGIITKYTAGEATIEDPASFELTIKISGKPVIATVASGGLTALALTGAGGALSPAFGAALRSYTYIGVTAASVTITPTAASHTIKLYIDGVYSQDISSGAASAAIALTIAVSKLLTLVVNEAGKTPISYNVIVNKVS